MLVQGSNPQHRRVDLRFKIRLCLDFEPKSIFWDRFPCSLLLAAVYKITSFCLQRSLYLRSLSCLREDMRMNERDDDLQLSSESNKLAKLSNHDSDCCNVYYWMQSKEGGYRFGICSPPIPRTYFATRCAISVTRFSSFHIKEGGLSLATYSGFCVCKIRRILINCPCGGIVGENQLDDALTATAQLPCAESSATGFTAAFFERRAHRNFI